MAWKDFLSWGPAWITLAFAAIFGYWKLRDRALSDNIQSLKEEIGHLREWRHNMNGDMAKQFAGYFMSITARQDQQDIRMRDIEDRLREIGRKI